MHYAHTIILTIVLVTFFCCFFGWCLMKSCRRVIDAEMQEVAEQRELEAQRTVVSGGSSNSAAKSKSSKAKSKASGKASKVNGSKGGSKKWGGSGVAKSVDGSLGVGNGGNW